MITLLISPFVISALLYLFALRNADYNILTTFFVAVGISLGTFIISNSFGADLGYFIFGLIFILSGFLIWKFCYTTILQTIFVAAIFVVYLVFFPDLMQRLFCS